MLATAFADIAFFLGVIVVVGGAYFLSRMLEPHWVAKDGVRFIAAARELDEFGIPRGGMRDVRGRFTGDGLEIRIRARGRSRRGHFRVTERADAKRATKFDYKLAATTLDAGVVSLSLRVPRTSPLVAELDRLVKAQGGRLP